MSPCEPNEGPTAGNNKYLQQEEYLIGCLVDTLQWKPYRCVLTKVIISLIETVCSKWTFNREALTFLSSGRRRASSVSLNSHIECVARDKSSLFAHSSVSDIRAS